MGPKREFSWLRKNSPRLPRPSLWPRRNLSRKSSAISPKDSRMPRPAPARVKSSHLHWPKTQRWPRKSSAAGWTNTPPSTANSRPLTTKCPDIREPLPTKCPDTINPVISQRDHPFHFIFFYFIILMNGFFPKFLFTNVSRSFFSILTLFLLLVQIAADFLSSSSHFKYKRSFDQFCGVC